MIDTIKPNLLKATSLIRTDSIVAEKTRILSKITLTVSQNIEWENGRSYGDIIIDVDPATLSEDLIKELMDRI